MRLSAQFQYKRGRHICLDRIRTIRTIERQQVLNKLKFIKVVGANKNAVDAIGNPKSMNMDIAVGANQNDTYGGSPRSRYVFTSF